MNIKYEFIKTDVIKIDDITLTRIKSLLTGDLGGYIEKEENLDQVGNAWVSTCAQVSGNASISGNAQISGNARISGNAQVYGSAWVHGDAWVYGNAWVSNNVEVSGNAQVYGSAKISGNAQVYGSAKISGNAWVYGNARVHGDAWVSDTNSIIWFSNVGSQQGTLTAYKLNDGEIELTRGCFRGTVLEFLNASKKTHNLIIQSEYELLIEVAISRLNRTK